MKERPILFSAPMIRALLAGTKTQTRRVLKQPHGLWETSTSGGFVPIPAKCPYGKPGDRLWVREAWRSGKLTDRFPPREMVPHVVWYEEDGQAPESTNGKLRPGMFMPRWASRITLEITGVRVERLQDISEADAQAEGCESLGWDGKAGPADLIDWPLKCQARPYANAYALLWESINGPGSWDANPWVWVVEFRRL